MFEKNSGEKCPTDSVYLVLEKHFQTKLIPIFEQNYTFFSLCHGRTSRKSFFFENPKLLGLSRQIGPKNVGAFWVLSAQTTVPNFGNFVHGFEYIFFQKIFGS